MSGLDPLCLVTAVEIEFRTAVNLLTEREDTFASGMKICRGRCGSRRVTVLISGMGAVGFADKLKAHLAQNRYQALIVAGLAGGLDPDLKIGQAVVYHRCDDARHNFSAPALNSIKMPKPSQQNPSIACDHNVSEFILGAFRAAGLDCVSGTGVTVGKVVDRASDKAALRDRYRAAALDMETYEILNICSDSGLPAAALRLVSDEAESDLPDFNRALRADGRISAPLMAMVLLKRPVASLRFILSMSRVIRAFREGLQALLNESDGIANSTTALPCEKVDKQKWSG